MPEDEKKITLPLNNVGFVGSPQFNLYLHTETLNDFKIPDLVPGLRVMGKWNRKEKPDFQQVGRVSSSIRNALLSTVWSPRPSLKDIDLEPIGRYASAELNYLNAVGINGIYFHPHQGITFGSHLKISGRKFSEIYTFARCLILISSRMRSHPREVKARKIPDHQKAGFLLTLASDAFLETKEFRHQENVYFSGGMTTNSMYLRDERHRDEGLRIGFHMSTVLNPESIHLELNANPDDVHYGKFVTGDKALLLDMKAIFPHMFEDNNETLSSGDAS
jgi:hypothetical protein